MNRATRDYDVVVVGAGPAGASAALFARRYGLHVGLIDKRRFPRDKICGDAVARKSLGYMRELGLFERLRTETHEPIDAAVLASPDGTSIRVDLNPNEHPQEPHLVCRREIFDDILVRAARAELDVHEGCSVTDLTRHGDTITGVRCRMENGESLDISARVVVGADGYNSAVARNLGLYRYDSRRWWVGTRAYYRNVDVAPGTVEVHYVDHTLPGFLWFFPTGDGIVNVGIGVIHRDLKRRGKSVRQLHETVVASKRFRARFEGAERLGGIVGWHLPAPDMSRTIQGDGFLLAGDAAGLVDPFSGEGIGNAMCSGEVAARISAAACEGKVFDAGALARYPAQLWEALDTKELSLHYRLRSLARQRWLLNFIIGRAAAHPDVLDWIVSMTDEHGAAQRKRALTSPLTYLRLLFWENRLGR